MIELNNGRQTAECSPELLSTVEGIARVVDGWRRPSEMTDDLAWLVAFMVGMWWVEPGPDSSASDAWTAERQQALQEEALDWSTRSCEIAALDRHRAWRLALERWVRSIPTRPDDVEIGTPADFSRRLAGRLEDLWPKLDEMSPYVGYQLACALAAGAGEAELKAAARRLSPGLLEPGRALGEWGERLPIYAWLREVARREPVLALKLGLEARLRRRVPGGTEG